MVGAMLPVKKVFPDHYSMEIHPEILIRMRDALRQPKAEGKLHHGSRTLRMGTEQFGCKVYYRGRGQPCMNLLVMKELETWDTASRPAFTGLQVDAKMAG